MQNKKVLLAMSGGIDSSASAIILKNKGYDVTGITLNMIKENNTAISDAKHVCEILGIPHIVLEAQDIFKNKVIENFIEMYKNAKTPNPCIMCNIYLKFGILYNYMMENNYDYIATGHYARIEYNEEFNQNVIIKSVFSKKDQSYVLYGIEKEKLNHILFPLGDITSKEECKKILEEKGLNIISDKKDSQDICFIKNNDYAEFLQLEAGFKPKEGNVIDKETGKILGKHKGIMFYTIGQRKGLGISSKAPLFVIDINKEKNEIVLGKEEELYTNSLIAENCNFQVDLGKIKDANGLMAKIRYASEPSEVKIEKYGDAFYKFIFNKPQRAITKGQAVVLYKNNILIGGGTIA